MAGCRSSFRARMDQWIKRGSHPPAQGAPVMTNGLVPRPARTAMATRALSAERIIRAAYGITRPQTARRVVRFELLGGSVALAVFRHDGDVGQTCVRVARRLDDGRAVQMRKASRNRFANLHEFLAYFDEIYARYGQPTR